MHYTFYKYKGESGERYFRVTEPAKQAGDIPVVQVCLDKGVSNSDVAAPVSISVISRNTIFSSYVHKKGFEKCDPDEFHSAWDKALSILKTQPELVS